MEVEKSQIISNSNYSFFNPLVNKRPIGPVLAGEAIDISLIFPKEYNVWDVKIIIENDNRKVIKECLFDYQGNNEYIVSFKISEWGLYWYYFTFRDCYGSHGIYASDDLGGVLSDNRLHLYQLSIHDAFDEEANWFDNCIMYQIMTDRFFRAGNEEKKDYAIIHEDWYENPFYKPVGKDWNIDFFGGDLKGIIAKLDYLEGLNVSVIYLNPIFLARSTHKYDTANYLEIDPMFGNEDDFVALCKKAKAKGIKIIIDMVLNHTGEDSIYFNKYNHFDSVGAYQSPKSKYRDWYSFGKYYKNGYRAWWDIESLPAVNQKNEEYLEFIDQVLTKWLRLGASGVRLDVVDELNNDFVDRINKVCKSVGKDKIIIGEVWEDASNKMAYGVRKNYFNGHELDSVMNYVFKKAIISFLKDGNYHNLRNSIRNVINNYPKYVVDKLMNILDTHDTMRIVNNFYNYHPKNKADAGKFKPTSEVKELAICKQKMATVLQFTLPGIPCIYYGDEAGLDGFDDPYSRKAYPWGKEDLDLFNWYKALTKMRQDPIFVGGDYQEVHFSPTLVIYKRIKDGKEILVIVNNSNVFYEDNLSAYDMLEEKDVEKIHLSPYSAKVYKLK